MIKEAGLTPEGYALPQSPALSSVSSCPFQVRADYLLHKFVMDNNGGGSIKYTELARGPYHAR